MLRMTTLNSEYVVPGICKDNFDFVPAYY